MIIHYETNRMRGARAILSSRVGLRNIYPRDSSTSKTQNITRGLEESSSTQKEIYNLAHGIVLVAHHKCDFLVQFAASHRHARKSLGAALANEGGAYRDGKDLSHVAPRMYNAT